MTPPGRTVPDVFISYRREDAPAHAGRLYDRLTQEFGEDHVFMDVASIDLGVDWMQVLQRKVTSCDVLLAVIGPEWLDAADGRGGRRLDDPADYVRFEIQTALDRGVPVVPILVERAERPPTDSLPDALRELTRRQELRIDDATFQSDAGLLAHRLRRAFREGADELDTPVDGDGKTSGSGASAPRPWAGIALASAAVLAVGLVAFLALRPDGTTGDGMMTERQAVDRVAGLLEFSAVGRQARLDERWNDAVSNRRETVRRVRALQEEETPIDEDVDLLADASEASLAAVEAYRDCGGADCAPEESRAALRAKRAFLAAFNPRARRLLDREWGPGDF